MASKKVSIQEEHVLKLILEFLSSRKYYKSARTLEKETGVNTNKYSENISFFRDLVLDGDWEAVREFGEPLADIPTFQYRRFNFLLAKQEYLEILFEKYEGNVINNEQSLRKRWLACLQNLERYCSFKEEYNKLYWYLSVPSLRSEPEFCNWSVDSSRVQLFEEMLELLKQFIPIEGRKLVEKNEVNDRLLSLLFKGSLYENCIEFCQKNAMGKTDEIFPSTVKINLFKKQSLKSTGNFYSWLHSLSKESFAEPFEELNFDLQLEKQKLNRTEAEIKQNSLSRSLTIEVKSPAKGLLQKSRDDRRKHLSDFPPSKPTHLDLDMRDVSQSFAEFEFAENGSTKQWHPKNYQKSPSNDEEVFMQNGEIHSTISVDPVSVPSSNVVQSPRKVRRDQQDLVFKQLEEHRQRQQELYDQLAETANLAKVSGIPMVKNGSKFNKIVPDEPSEALKKLERLKLLTESFEKGTKTDQKGLKEDVLSSKEDEKNRLNSARNSKSQSAFSFQDSRPNIVNLSSELAAKKSSSSTPGSAPKTPVNTCLPPGFVKLTDGSGTFNTSTPKAERQSFTTPLPASPVTSEQKHPRDNVLEQQPRNPTQVRRDETGQTPKAPGPRQILVRRSLVNTVFKDENTKEETNQKFQTRPTLTNNTGAPHDNHYSKPSIENHNSKTVEINSGYAAKNLESDPVKSSYQASFRSENDMKYSRFEDGEMITGRDETPSKTSLKTYSKNSTFQNHSEPSDFRVGACSNSSPLKFKKSAMLTDTQAIRAVAFHPAGNMFAVGTNSKALKICRKNESRSFERNDQNTTKVEELYVKPGMHKGSVYCVAFNSNGNIIATGSNDKTIKLLRFDKDNPVNLEDQMELSIHNATVRDLAFVNTAAGGHPVLASGGAGGGLIYLSDCYTGRTLSSLQGHAGNIMAVYASKQAHLLCSGSADKTVRLWDLRMAKCIDVITSSSCVTSVCFNNGETHSLFLASADDSGQCIVYDVGARKSLSSFTPHEMDCRSIRFSPDSQHILTGSYDACVAITAVQYNNTKILSDSYIVGSHRDKVIQCRWHPSEYSFLSSSADRTVVLWEQTL